MKRAARTSQEKQGCVWSSRAIYNGGFFCDYVIGWLEDTAHMSLK